MESYKCDPFVSDFFYFAQYFQSSSIHVVEFFSSSFLSWLKNIPLYYIPQFFIHLSADEHLVCFHLLSAMNNVMNICVQVFVLVAIYSRVKLLDHMVIVCLKLIEETPNCFPQWLHYFTLPSVMNKGSNFSTSSSTLLFLKLQSFYQWLPCGCHWQLEVGEWGGLGR